MRLVTTTVARPYYQDDLVTLYRADAHKFAGLTVDSIITDPVWPNASVFRVKDPYALLSSVLRGLWSHRLVVQLGCDSDPRFLTAVPDRYEFVRTCWLKYAQPSYKGRLLYTGDVAYVFGRVARAEKGKMVMPGEVTSTRADKLFARSTGRKKNKSFSREVYEKLKHPAPRRLEHVMWLVKWFGGDVVLDPFAGSGTTLLACKRMGVRAIGIEINRSYAKLAADRLSAEPL